MLEYPSLENKGFRKLKSATRHHIIQGLLLILPGRLKMSDLVVIIEKNHR
jgi:hypothetical protein